MYSHPPSNTPVPVVANEPQWWMVGSVPGVLDELARVAARVDEGGDLLRGAHQRLASVFETARDAGLPVIID